MYANMCGFRSWDEVIAAIQINPPSQPDEQISTDVLETRMVFYADVLISIFGLNPRFARYFLEHVSPSSCVQPRRFSIDRDEMYEPSEDNVTLVDLLEEGFPGDQSALEETLDDFAKDMLGDVMPEGFSFENFHQRLRISKPIFPGHWYNLLATLKWNIDDDSYSEDYTYGEESFVVLGKNDVEIPVYLTSLSRVPLDHDDEMANHTMELVQHHCEELFGSDKALLFWGGPLTKEIKGERFSHFGMCLNKGKWHEFLLHQGATLDSVLEQGKSIPDIDDPDPRFADKKNVLAHTFVCMAMDIPEGSEVQITEIGSASGWCSILAVED
ncbi:MAG: hypothetical protein C9356_11770 [Oleiphilus sp.]|nr:MAG: hypothetical protein C9356_11770 [Oleiphilus sp.]